MDPQEPTSSQSPIFSNSPTSQSLIYVLGAPGAGKGTLCKLLASTYKNIHHLSMGDHLRSLISQTSPTQTSLGGMDHAEVSARLQRHELLPANTIVAITRKAIEDIIENLPSTPNDSPGNHTILIDGFPRSPESAKIADITFGKPDKVLFFDCPREIAEERFLKRRRSVDDGVEVFARRYAEFERLNGDILGLYGGWIVRVGTDGETEESWEILKGIVGGIVMVEE